MIGETLKTPDVVIVNALDSNSSLMILKDDRFTKTKKKKKN